MFAQSKVVFFLVCLSFVLVARLGSTEISLAQKSDPKQPDPKKVAAEAAAAKKAFEAQMAKLAELNRRKMLEYLLNQQKAIEAQKIMNQQGAKQNTPGDKQDPSESHNKPADGKSKGTATAKSKPSDDPQKIAAQQQRAAQLAQQTNALMAACMAINGAADSYGGHKNSADGLVRTALARVNVLSMHQIEPRLNGMRAFNKSEVAQYVLTGRGAGYVQKILSDSQLANARIILRGLNGDLTPNNDYKKISGYVNGAINEINAALALSQQNQLKGQEADVLTVAYVLLDTANANYAGHRVAAMRAVNVACDSLEKGLLNNGNLLLKIKGLRDSNIAAAADFKSSLMPGIRENQYYSDAQLLMADSLIQRVALYLLANETQMDIVSNLNVADREIHFALIIN